jgi:hypothetical protein
MNTPILKKVRQRSQKGWRRRYSRHRADFPLKATALCQEGYVEIQGRCGDIGHGGLGAVLRTEVSTGEVISLEFVLPPASEPFQARAIVRYRRGFAHGFEFLGLSNEQQAAVDAFCAGREVVG